MGPWQISVVTYMEVAQGCRNRLELNRLKMTLAANDTTFIHLTPDISQRASDLIDDLALSHGLQLGDALIGATAITLGLPLLSANAKHFRPMDELMLEVFLP
jgi:predicted nucleic acid-binding protein